jgi:hypothetical protein
MQVTTETEELRYNTAIAAMMEFVNGVLKWSDRPRAALEPFLLLLAPYAPHLAEEMWASIGQRSSLSYSQWPQHDESLLVLDSINLAVQVGEWPGWLGGLLQLIVRWCCLSAGAGPVCQCTCEAEAEDDACLLLLGCCEACWRYSVVYRMALSSAPCLQVS